jgi:hypothetical protein
MKKTQQPIKKIDITSLKVIKRENLNTLYGGSAPAKWTSWSQDTDTGGFCSISSDTDTEN